MAATWDVKITVLDVAARRISVAATRTDSITGQIWTLSILDGIIATAQQKQDMIDNIWSQWQAADAREKQIMTILGQLETQAKQTLEAKEIP